MFLKSAMRLERYGSTASFVPSEGGFRLLGISTTTISKTSKFQLKIPNFHIEITSFCKFKAEIMS